MRLVLLLLFATVCHQVSFAQVPYSYAYLQAHEQGVEPAENTSDSSKWTEPKKVTVMALVLPGSGQIYNKKYLKAGIVYAGFGGLVYMFKYNSDSLSKYQEILISKLDTNQQDLAPLRSLANIRSDRDFHRRYRDISIIGFVALYALQAIDANVDAHLKEFSLNKDLSMRWSPDLYAIKPGIGRYTGMTFTLTF